MSLVHPSPKAITSFIKDFGPNLREKQLLAARKVQVAEASSIMTRDSCETVYGVFALSVKIYMCSLIQLVICS